MLLHLCEYMELFSPKLVETNVKNASPKWINSIETMESLTFYSKRWLDWMKKSHNYCIDWYQFRKCLWQCGDVTEKDERYESSGIRQCIRMEQKQYKGWLVFGEHAWFHPVFWQMVKRFESYFYPHFTITEQHNNIECMANFQGIN